MHTRLSTRAPCTSVPILIPAHTSVHTHLHTHCGTSSLAPTPACPELSCTAACAHLTSAHTCVCTHVNMCRGLHCPTHVSTGVCVCVAHTHLCARTACTAAHLAHASTHSSGIYTQPQIHQHKRTRNCTHHMHSYTSGTHRHLYTHICEHKHICMLTFTYDSASTDQQHMTKHRTQMAIHGTADIHQPVCVHTDMSVPRGVRSHENTSTRVCTH